MTDARIAAQPRYTPYVHIEGIRNPKLADVPALDRFQELADSERVVRSYDIRVRRPKVPWLAWTIGVLLTLLLLVGLVGGAASGMGGLGFAELLMVLAILLGIFWYIFIRPRRGHTYLFLTDRRVVIVELEEGFSGRSQTVLNYNIKDIAGFQVFAQRGIRRLLNIVKIREKRTFYIALITGSRASFALGALASRNSEYDPGRDAVTLCAELDSTLLAIKAGMTAGKEVA